MKNKQFLIFLAGLFILACNSTSPSGDAWLSEPKELTAALDAEEADKINCDCVNEAGECECAKTGDCKCGEDCNCAACAGKGEANCDCINEAGECECAKTGECNCGEDCKCPGCGNKGDAKHSNHQGGCGCGGRH